MAIQVILAYRSVSSDVAILLARMIPFPLLVNMDAVVFRKVQASKRSGTILM